MWLLQTFFLRFFIIHQQSITLKQNIEDEMAELSLEVFWKIIENAPKWLSSMVDNIFLT